MLSVGVIAGPLKPIGSSCVVGSECETGYCVGSGCEGKCVPMVLESVAAQVITAWCGCDGKTFYTPTSRPPYNKAYDHKGPCEAAKEPAPPKEPEMVPPPGAPRKWSWKTVAVIGLCGVAAVGTVWYVRRR